MSVALLILFQTAGQGRLGRLDTASYISSLRAFPSTSISNSHLLHTILNHYLLATNIMLSLHLTAFSLALLVLQAIGFPAPAPVSLLPRADDETWGIPSMHLHMMTRLSGLPGDGVWPSESKFPSSIDFAVDMPGQSFTCHTTFANGTLPEDLAACSGEGDRVGFRMLPYTASGSRRPETSFVLQVFRVKRDG